MSHASGGNPIGDRRELPESDERNEDDYRRSRTSAIARRAIELPCGAQIGPPDFRWLLAALDRRWLIMTPQDKISALDRVVNSESFNIANQINESHYTLFEKAIAELENEPKVLLNESDLASLTAHRFSSSFPYRKKCV
jgi:hypothetical protein